MSRGFDLDLGFNLGDPEKVSKTLLRFFPKGGIDAARVEARKILEAAARRQPYQVKTELAGAIIKVNPEETRPLDQCRAWVTLELAKDFRLTPCGESAAHKLVETLNSDRFHWPLVKVDAAEPLIPRHGWTFAHHQVFVIQHDWAAAFANAEGIDDGFEFQLPAGHCLFEGRVNGWRFVLDTFLGTDEYEGVTFAFLYVESSAGWCMVADLRWTPDGLLVPRLADPEHPLYTVANRLAAFLARQLRAICIGLEAEVATTETVRAPAKLNRQREKAGKAPLHDFHIVKLNRRERPAPVPAELQDRGSRARQRLHFVRGHWRHYQNHRTWIKWFLKGDPDLGFIDKEYRL